MMFCNQPVTSEKGRQVSVFSGALWIVWTRFTTRSAMKWSRVLLISVEFNLRQIVRNLESIFCVNRNKVTMVRMPTQLLPESHLDTNFLAMGERIKWIRSQEFLSSRPAGLVLLLIATSLSRLVSIAAPWDLERRSVGGRWQWRWVGRRRFSRVNGAAARFRVATSWRWLTGGACVAPVQSDAGEWREKHS